MDTGWILLWLFFGGLLTWTLFATYEAGKRIGYDYAKETVTRRACRYMREHGQSMMAVAFSYQQYGSAGLPPSIDDTQEGEG